MGSVFGKDFVFALSSKDPIDEDVKQGFGPIGKGDPDDFTLRPKEILVNIPALQAQAAMLYKCAHLGKAHDECVDNSVVFFFSCSKESEDLSKCVEYWSRNPEYREVITEEYLLLRQEFRKTGRRRLYRALTGSTYISPEKIKGFQV